MFITPKLKKLMINGLYAFYPEFQFSLPGLSIRKFQFTIQKLMKETKRTSKMEKAIL